MSKNYEQLRSDLQLLMKGSERVTSPMKELGRDVKGRQCDGCIPYTIRDVPDSTIRSR